MSSALKIEVIDASVISVSGELVTENVAKVDNSALVEQVLRSQSSLDLGGVVRSDTAGLAWVVFVVGKVKCSGKSISIVKPPAQLLKLAEISELTASLPLAAEDN